MKDFASGVMRAVLSQPFSNFTNAIVKSIYAISNFTNAIVTSFYALSTFGNTSSFQNLLISLPKIMVFVQSNITRILFFILTNFVR